VRSPPPLPGTLPLLPVFVGQSAPLTDLSSPVTV